MLRNILSQMSRQRDLYKFKQNSTVTNSTATQNATCVLFDGSIETLMDNLPLVVDLTLETVLISATTETSSSNNNNSLKETLCSFESTLDPLGEPAHLERQVKLREAICHLLHESSLATCSEALKFDQWTTTMRDLNVTWFEVSAISVRPSFRAILEGVHEFLELFGKVKPSSMSDGLIARVLNFQSYWTGLVNKALSSVEKYRERRFQVALQILLPIIYDNLHYYYENEPAINNNNNSSSTTTNSWNSNETRDALKTSILSATAIGQYLSKSTASNSTANESNDRVLSQSSGEILSPVETQLRSLFDWADRHSVVISETLVRTIARNITKLESLLVSDGLSVKTWTKFCSAPVATYLQVVDSSEQSPTAATIVDKQQVVNNKAMLPKHVRLLELMQAKETICQFDWTLFHDRLFAQQQHRTNGSNALPAQSSTLVSARRDKPIDSLEQYTTRQLIRVALTKWGQVLDLIASGTARTTRAPKFLALAHWRPLQEKLATLTPSEYEPTNLIWVWQAFEKLVNAADRTSKNNKQQHESAAESLARIFEQLNCALDTVKGGLSWENVVNIYQDRQDVLAAYNTLTHGITLATASANTFLAHKKFQKFLNNFVRPRAGLSAFCDMRDKSRLENVFSLSASTTTSMTTIANADDSENELSGALESFQEFICDTHLETFVQNINPISVCYHHSSSSPVLTNSSNSSLPRLNSSSSGPLADSIDRFVKLASLAILDAKLIDHTSDHSKPAIFDPNQWTQLRSWWLNQTEAHQGNSGLALTLVRLFQTLDSINSEHVIWRAIFRSVHELSEVSAYLVRAAGIEQHQQQQAKAKQKVELEDSLPSLTASKIQARLESTIITTNSNNQSLLLKSFGPKQQQQLASTITNVMFPEMSNFISLKTFKQLRYIRSISDYFTATPGAQQLICRRNLTETTTTTTQKPQISTNTSSIDTESGEDDVEDEDAIDNVDIQQQQPANANNTNFEHLSEFKLNSSERLHSLLCQYHSSQWLSVMNIVLSNRTTSLAKKANYMTKYLMLFTKNYPHNEHMQSFIHGQQLENIEAVANTTVSYLIALTQPFRALTLSKISNISWHSIPNLLDSIDRHLCASKFEQQQQQQNANQTTTTVNNNSSPTFQLAVYEPKKPDIETIICKLPSWNITQVYAYLSENIDLQNMISLVIQNNHTAKLLGITTTSNHTITTTTSNSTVVEMSQQNQTTTTQQIKSCITPFKFASKWLKIGQDLIDETMSKTSRNKIRKCLSLNKKNQSIYLQTLRYVKILNSLLSTINELTINNSWPIVRKTWKSISYALLNQSGQGNVGIPAGLQQQQQPQ